jgi:transposase
MTRVRAVLGLIPDISLTATPSEQPVLRILTTLEFQLLPPDGFPFMTLSPLALAQLKQNQTDLFTFRPSNGSRRIRNIFLLGATLTICLVPQPAEQRLHHLIAEMGGCIRSDSRVDFVISPEPIATTSGAKTVHPIWIESLWASGVFIPPAQCQPLVDWPPADVPDLGNRSQSIAFLLRCGKSYDEIALKCHASKRDISKVKKAIEAGIELPVPKHRGRPSVITPEVVQDVRDMTTEDPHLGSGKLAHCLREKFHVEISRQTVSAIRNELRFRWTKARHCPLIDSEQERKRIAFCQESLEGTIDWTQDVIISDESRFGLYDDSRSMWIQRGVYSQRTFQPVPKHDTSIMVWGAIGKGFKSKLIVVKGTLNAERYQLMLRDNGVINDMVSHFGDRQGFFQQDGAPAHTAKSSVSMLQELIRLITNWPPSSPDMSPIENVWGILKIRIAAREPKSVGELATTLMEEWDNLDQRIIDGLMDTMPSRFRMCVAAQGKSIGHLVRRMGHHHGSELSPTNSAGGEVATMLISRLEMIHVGTIVQVTGSAGAVRLDQQNPALLWVEMHDLPTGEPSGQHRRKPGSVGMMIRAEERGLIPGIPFTFQAEVHAASGRFVAGAPTKMTQRHKLHLYLRLIAVREEIEPDHGAEPPEPDEAIDFMERGNPEMEIRRMAETIPGGRGEPVGRE